jgi:hypothetical protein
MESPAAGAETVAGAGGVAAPEHKPKPQKDWRDARIGEVSARLRQEERRRLELEQEVQRLRQPQQQPAAQLGAPAAAAGLSPAEVDRLAEQKAREMEFTRQCNNAYSRGKGEFQDFDAKLADVQQAGGFPRQLIEAALELEEDGGLPVHTTLYNLATDLDEFTRVKNLSPSRMAAALIRLANKSPGKQVSSAPEPPGRLARGPATPPQKDPEQMPMREWLEWREKTARKGRRG